MATQILPHKNTVAPHERAEPGKRQKVVLTGRDGLAAAVKEDADFMGGVQKVSDPKVLEALEKQNVLLQQLFTFLMSNIK